jgi:hypothetical protein
MEDRSLKKRRTKVNAVGGTPKGRTREKKRWMRPKCNNGIRGRGAGQHQRLEGIRLHRELIRQSLDLEIAKLIVKSHIGLREPGGWTTVELSAPAEAEEVTT